jgi:lipopolysaccharide transport system permease protein
MNQSVTTPQEASPPVRPNAPAPLAPADDMPELVIRPRPGWIAVDWAELYRYRELLYFLVWRDVKVRYKQTVLGAAWAILQPVFYMIIFGLIFGNLVGVNEALPGELSRYFAMWLFAGLLPWMLFQTAMTDGGMSLVNQQHLLTKIYLPRLFVPAATIGRGLVDMLLAFIVFAGLLAWYQPPLAWTLLFLPLLILLTALAGLGMAYVLAAMSVTYRDFRFIIPFLAQALMWLSFVAVPPQLLGDYQATAAVDEETAAVELLSERYPELREPLRTSTGHAVPGLADADVDSAAGTRHTVLRYGMALNPMFGIVQSYRAALFADLDWDIPMLLVSTGSTVAIFTFGLFFYRKTERRFADIA